MSQHRSIRVLLLQGTIFSALTLPFATAAMAQDAAGNAAKDASEEIVVTGTQIRGITPVGTEAVTIDAAQIQETPGLSTDAVLATIPQISNFFNVQLDQLAGQGTPTGVNTPEIHGLPTLILLDGHRIAPAGANLTGVDPSIIPKGVLSGIEVVPDGGSALYGSDAVGGVINLTTKKRFDGVDVDGDVGLASGAQTYRLDATVGKSWDSGSIYLAYAFDKQTPLFGYQRPYIHYTLPNTGCSPTTVQPSILENIPGFGTFPIPLGASYNPSGIGANGKPTGYTAGALSNCNEYTNESVTNEEHEHSVFAGWSQDISSKVSLDTRAFYSVRSSKAYNIFNTNSMSQTLPQSNFYYTPTPAETALGPAAALATQTVGFSYLPALGVNNVPSTNRFDTWGASTQLTADIGHGFQTRLLGDFSQSNLKGQTIGVNNTLLASALASSDEATALDPYDVAGTPQSTTIAREIDDEMTTTTGKTNEYQARLVTDGPLFHIPGGDVKIAAGGEVLHDSYTATSMSYIYDGTVDPNVTPQDLKAGRTVASAFGELNVPVVSAANNVPLIHELDFSAAGRYDHYSDFGSTFNPRLAASLLPVDWFTLRSTWSRSFVAPQLYQEFQPGSAGVSPAIPFLLPPGDTADVNKNLIILMGGNANLEPQKARSWTVGGDMRVPFIDGLKAGLTYYNTVYTNEIGIAPFYEASLFFSGLYSKELISHPTLAQAQQIIGTLPVTGQGFTSISQLYGPGGAITANSPAYIEDAREQNLSQVDTSGLDINVSYRHPTTFGAVNFSVGANYILTDNATGGPGQPFVDQLLTSSRFHGSFSAGADIGRFQATATVLHTSGFGLLAGASPTGQTSVSAYNEVNTFFSYTLKSQEGYVNGTELRLNIQNLFNARPTVDTTSTTGYDKESVLGRVWQLGFHKKF